MYLLCKCIQTHYITQLKLKPKLHKKNGEYINRRQGRYNINYAYCGMFKSIVMLKSISEHVHKEISEIGENTMLHCYEEGRRKEEN